MKKTQLSKAIAFALTGAALSFGAASNASAASTTMYNLTTAGGVDNSANTTDPVSGTTWGLWNTATDGWTNGAGPSGTPVGTLPAGYQKWAGTSSASTAAFGYTGAHLNWGAEFTGGSNTATISTYDAFANYGVYADIDTAKGAWSDAALATANESGWRHDLEMGLFKTDTAGTITLSVTGIIQSGTDFGFTIFKGMDTVTNYDHHGSWNAGNNASGINANASSPWKTPIIPGVYGAGAAGQLSTSDIVAYSVGGVSPSNLNTISFNAEAGQIYSIFLGGYRNGAWGDTNDGYSLTISTAPVPLPGAAWLFGGAIASLIGANRRKRVVPA